MSITEHQIAEACGNIVDIAMSLAMRSDDADMQNIDDDFFIDDALDIINQIVPIDADARARIATMILEDAHDESNME